MKASKVILAAMVAASSVAAAAPVAVSPAPAAVAATPAPTTIGELSEQARQKRVAEAAKALAPTLAPVLPAAGLQAAPVGLTMVPSTEILTPEGAAGSQKIATKKVKPAPPPEVLPQVLAIARKAAGARSVELADGTVQSSYNIGQVTPSGWTVSSIGSSTVELTKPAVKKKPARHLTLSLVTP
jgi:hypothetical protein